MTGGRLMIRDPPLTGCAGWDPLTAGAAICAVASAATAWTVAFAPLPPLTAGAAMRAVATDAGANSITFSSGAAILVVVFAATA